MIDLITIIIIATLTALFVLAYAWGCTQHDRCASLEAELDRKDAILADHLAASDKLLATVDEVQQYNAWLERRNTMLDMQRRGGVTVLPVTWELN